MFVIVDSNTLFSKNSEPLPGAVEAMREIAMYDQLVYISSQNTDSLNAALLSSDFPATQIISCSDDSEKLLAILRHVRSKERITFISTAQVLKALNTDRIWNDYPRGAANLASRFVFIVHGVEQISRDLLPYAEFPIEAQSSWQETAPLGS